MDMDVAMAMPSTTHERWDGLIFERNGGSGQAVVELLPPQVDGSNDDPIAAKLRARMRKHSLFVRTGFYFHVAYVTQFTGPRQRISPFSFATAATCEHLASLLADPIRQKGIRVVAVDNLDQEPVIYTDEAGKRLDQSSLIFECGGVLVELNAGLIAADMMRYYVHDDVNDRTRLELYHGIEFIADAVTKAVEAKKRG